MLGCPNGVEHRHRDRHGHLAARGQPNALVARRPGVVAGLVYLMATASTGPVDPTEVAHPQSHATVVFNSAMIVFREGLEAVLIFAAVTASFLGANTRRRRPVVAGAGVRVRRRGRRPGSWSRPCSTPPRRSARGSRRSPASSRSSCCWSSSTGSCTRSTGREWIGRHHRQRRKLLAQTGSAATVGLVALGFTSVYREGFEVVLFLQNLQLQAGSGTVLEGVAIGLAGDRRRRRRSRSGCTTGCPTGACSSSPACWSAWCSW